MMEELMYGWMLSAKIVAEEKAPPDMTLYRPRTVFSRERKYSCR